jgi:hypothetical protein
MTNEERDIISQFIARVGGGQAQSGFSAGSVPATQQPALPPVDQEADQFIAQAFQRYPEARYRVTQLAFVQDHALVEAQNRIKRLEWELQQAQAAVQQAQQQQAQQQQAQQQQAPQQQASAPSGGFFSGLFGGGRQSQGGAPSGPGPGPGGPWGQQAPPQQGYYQPNAGPPPPQYPPNYQQGMFQRQGSGFLGSALTTAAGVAGGVVAGNALMSLFSPHSSFGGGGASPWGAPVDPNQGNVDTGAWGGGGMPAGNQDYVDNSGWDQNTGGGDASWTDNSGGGGGGDSSWTDDSSSSDSGGSWDSGGGSDDTL